jgi:hypothetical protein
MDWKSKLGCLRHSMARFEESASYRAVGPFGGVSMHSNRLPYATLNGTVRFLTSFNSFSMHQGLGKLVAGLIINWQTAA